jgi:cytochrome c-type biogenesis protein
MFGLDINTLIFPAFIAGILTFLAPCTLPLLPAYLGFIGGVSFSELKSLENLSGLRRRVLFNGFLYVFGFSLVFVLLGILFGLGGGYLVQYRILLSRIGGVIIMIFGLWMLGVFNLKSLNFFQIPHRFNFIEKLKPGEGLSSLIFGATFAFGWSPCIGPILGTILLLASTGATVASGAFLLVIFSMGLAIPFLLTAWFFSSLGNYLLKINRYLKVINIIGGCLLLLLGWVLLTESFISWIGFFYKIFNFANYESLYNYF